MRTSMEGDAELKGIIGNGELFRHIGLQRCSRYVHAPIHCGNLELDEL